MDNSETGQKKQDVSGIAEDAAPTSHYTSPRQTPPPQYSQTNYNTRASSLPPQPPNYDSPALGASSQHNYGSPALEIPSQPPNYGSPALGVPSQPPNYSSPALGVPSQPPNYGSPALGVPSQPPNYGSHALGIPSQPNYGSPALGVPQQPSVGSTYPSSCGVPAVNYLPGKKKIVETYMLAVSPLGLLGAHHFYLQRFYWGIVYFFTGGLLGCGYLIDWFRVPCLVKEANEKIRNPELKYKKSVSDAYTLWFPMGLLGFHHYYLGNYAWGVIYTCTLGLCGIGWIVDAVRIPYLVKSCNENQHLRASEGKNACLTVALAVSPIGILGAHHYYLNRPVWGLIYTFTLGLGGLGWLIDCFRLSVLIKRANKEISGDRAPNVKTLDDAYILWFPFGLLGLHHFYLERPIWGLLYLFTLGLGGIGWLIDIVRIPGLVKEANMKSGAVQERRALTQSLASTAGVLPTQGYTNYAVANQATFAPINPSWLYPPQGGAPGYSYYQQNGGPSTQTPEKPPLQNYPQTGGPHCHPAHNGVIVGPQFLIPDNDSAPPPYQPSESSRDV